MGFQRLKHIIFMDFVYICDTFQTVLVFLQFATCLTQDFRAPPILPNEPYLWVWNAPTEYCTTRHSVTISMKMFSLVGNHQKHVIGQGIRTFYEDKLGFYPYVDSRKAVHNGGIPQKGNVGDHVNKCADDINLYLPNDDVGLAVITWQEWRPLWLRNWGAKEVYKRMSIDLVKNETTGLDEKTINDTAKVNFETAAKNFMVETLKQAKKLRPKRYWGFYLFPDCYNNHYDKPNYTGHCFDTELKRNDELNWLWRESTALYPNIYLNTKLKASPLASLFTRNRIQEAIRLSKVRGASDPLPVFVYSRPVFTDASGEYLSEADLVSTLGESVALGASGNILWGSTNLTQSKQSCMKLDEYMKTTLLPYIINVSLAAKMCSQVLCYSQGICVRKDWNTNDYLHLSSESFYIEYGHCDRFIVSGEPLFRDLQYFHERFNCSCFSNTSCQMRHDLYNIDLINVCIGNNVCLSAIRRENITKRYHGWKGKLYKNSNNSFSSKSPYTVSRCTPGKNISGCLNTNFFKGLIFTNSPKDCCSVNQKNTCSDLTSQNNINKASNSSICSVLIQFPIYILYILMSFMLLYLR